MTEEQQHAKEETAVTHDVQYEDEETKDAVSIQNHSLKHRINNQLFQVTLAKVETKTGTEGLECIFKMRVKLYRFREEWKERGIGNCKLMRDRKDKRIRFVMRQEKTLKPVANFICKSPF